MVSMKILTSKRGWLWRRMVFIKGSDGFLCLFEQTKLNLHINYHLYFSGAQLFPK